ncbi:alpha-galactosidase [Paenibacillus aurantiacus]|uniref:Alpha-galactosidase n=1 Tax=Paenibacillus aurantiacus TaxID=1936118 RepID=A0ABV5KS08_9BACL
MTIKYTPEQKLFHLQAKDTSYIIHIAKDTYPTQLYWGAKIRNADLTDMLGHPYRVFSPLIERQEVFTLDVLPQEYPGYGTGDFREPAFQIQLPNGTCISELHYEGYTIKSGKPTLAGLPSVYTESDDEAVTLVLTLKDALIGLKAELSYTVFVDHNVITRSVRFYNEGSEPIRLLRAFSASVDFPHDQFDFLQLSGAWVRERHIVKRPLDYGKVSVESRRGASSHMQNPFLALLSKDATEETGEVYGMSLVYSGNFIAQVDVDQYRTSRAQIGLHPVGFNWHLEPGESFQAPEAVLVFSDSGLGGMSRTYHKLYRTRLVRGKYRDEPRPILINNWEATYFDFTPDKIERIAKAGQELGLELFVLDDGWFGKRNHDDSSLGDWFVNQDKLPNGLTDLADRVNNLGMQFGLWFEPEMVSVDSELYRSHPDWCLHVPDRRRTESRNQLILDYSRADVRSYIIQTISDLLSSANIRYVKWDMNRNMTEVGSALLPPERQQETAHRYILGLYEVMDAITSRFPHILFESCSGGGGRFDPGMLFYMPQTWTSDNTDAVERLKIQYGTSIVYPASTMGSHVSASPNHQVGRVTSLEMRGDVALSGNFGYELDLSTVGDDEKSTIKQQVAFCKEVRSLVQFADFYRLLSPFDGNETAWMFISEDRITALVGYFRVLAEPNPVVTRLRLKSLDPSKDYRLEGTDEIYGGDRLMNAGIQIPVMIGDFQSKMMYFKAI